MEKLTEGQIINSWCSKHQGESGKGKSTRHLWQSVRLVCLECHPEADPEKEQQEVRDEEYNH